MRWEGDEGYYAKLQAETSKKTNCVFLYDEYIIFPVLYLILILNFGPSSKLKNVDMFMLTESIFMEVPAGSKKVYWLLMKLYGWPYHDYSNAKPNCTKKL